MIERSDIKEIGVFQRTHGLKGELNAIFEIDPEFFDEGEHPLIVEIEAVFVPFYADSIRDKGATSYLVKIEGIDTQQEAQELVNHKIFADNEALKDFLGESELLQMSDVIGYKIVDGKLGEIGVVGDIDDSTENVIVVVDRPDGSEVMIPLVDEFISEIDEANRTINVNVPEELLTLNVKKGKEDE